MGDTSGRGVTVLLVAGVSVLGLSISAINGVGQVPDYRPVAASGVWRDASGGSGEWSAQAGFQGRSVVGEITVFDHGVVGDATLEFRFSEAARLENGSIRIDGDDAATVLISSIRGVNLSGTFDLGAGETGRWEGTWRGTAPTAENGWVARPPRGVTGTKRSRGSIPSSALTEVAAIGGRLARAATINTNNLVSQPNDPPTADPADQHQVEVEVAVDRSDNSDRIALVAIDAYQYPNVMTGAPDLSYYISPDGGLSWPAHLRGDFPGLATFNRGADPVAVYDRNGDLFVCALAKNGSVFNEAIFVSRMPVGSNAFNNASLVTTTTIGEMRDLDKPWCATGVIGGQDVLYVVYVDTDLSQSPPVSSIDLVFSTDGGLTFHGPFAVADSDDPTWPQVEVDLQGKVNVVWADNDIVGVGGTVDISFDQCVISLSPPMATCGTDKLVDTITKPDDPLPLTTFRMSWFPYMAIDNMPDGPNRIYIVWTNKSSFGDTDILFKYSSAQVVDFGMPSAEIVNFAEDEFFPAIEVDKNHFVRVSYLSRTSNTENKFNVYDLWSGDGGNTWPNETRVNSMPPIDALNLDFIGDYIGIDGKFLRHHGWMDSREGDFDVFSASASGC